MKGCDLSEKSFQWLKDPWDVQEGTFECSKVMVVPHYLGSFSYSTFYLIETFNRLVTSEISWSVVGL
ncbi:hypothetical protein H5410_064609 [Solanum commersonii]|uniref:Uncharacterized protein n=1 Tax=Solanum commersonii TaxID=4109 RepID=A0A9J5VZ73_SOLCO|nr:hypothetical protein H5410_064609 [Solanum commersonii]